MTLDPAAPPTDEPASRHSSDRHRGLSLLTGLLLLALIVAAVLLGIRSQHRHHAVDRARAATQAEGAVLAAARGEAVALTTLSYKDPNGGLNRILAGATGALKARFAAERTQLPKLLATNKSVSTGSALSSGLTSLHGNAAQAVVAVDATVSGSDLKSGVVKHYRVVVTLQHLQGHWLASDVAFAGVPPT